MGTRIAGVGLLLLLLAGSARPAHASQVTPSLPGFTAEALDALGTRCESHAPTAMVASKGTVVVANRVAYRRLPGSEFETSGMSAWGLAVAGDTFYATQPGCFDDVTVHPVDGSNCRVVEFLPGTGKVTRTVSMECGYAMALDPGTGNLTVATRDGRIVGIRRSDGATVEELVTGLGGDPAVSLDWAPDGRRLFFAQLSGTAVVVTRGGGRRTLPVTGVTGVTAGTAAVNLEGHVLLSVPGERAVRVVSPDGKPVPGPRLAAVSSPGRAMVATGEGVLLMLHDELWLLRGRYAPPAPPPPAPTATPAAARVPVAAAPSAPPPPPPAQPPPPPPPPAPPVPPLATAAQLVAQPSAVANPAIVPGEEEREAALRLAAVGREPPMAPWLVWLLLAVVACAGGTAVGAVSRRTAVASAPARSRS